MQLKQENFPLTVKDYLVSKEEFILDFDAEKEMLLTNPKPEATKLSQ